jgi:hypothetical protein
MIVVSGYRGYGFHVTAVPADDRRWNAEVKLRSTFLSMRSRTSRR